VVVGFDRADRNKDGKLSLAEYNRLGEKATRAAKRSASASTGASRSANASAGASSDQPRPASGGMRSANSR
jgi:hypothetical protein